MSYRKPLGGINVVTICGKQVGVEQGKLNDNIFIDTNYSADQPRCYIIKRGKNKGKCMYINRIKKINP